MGLRAEQRERTRSVLLDVSRRLFAARGYAGVGLADLVGEAGVTKGALYHHFEGGKSDLFRAVVEQVHEEIGTTVAAAADAESDPWDQLTAGCRAFLVAATDPAVRRILLIDGPAVLGWREWRAIDDAQSASHLVESLELLVETGVIAQQPVVPLARLLSGAMNEAALWLAETDDPGALDDVTTALFRLLGALRT
ncbi:TetR/AcrR family transcriptional regulator [Kribbella italica]|uniref:AcrR family transcriptional regulator n=1 Tax=Kribbella italica TaxID=1540520 RepID=A0A7W9MTZ1_9ACTN|nr:TetR/AcrR family transcriptional regulator [Kribbella italica]MBB5836204.1 AcrR family transcriptional regulator [Kribbella italica]